MAENGKGLSSRVRRAVSGVASAVTGSSGTSSAVDVVPDVARPPAADVVESPRAAAGSSSRRPPAPRQPSSETVEPAAEAPAVPAAPAPRRRASAKPVAAKPAAAKPAAAKPASAKPAAAKPAAAKPAAAKPAAAKPTAAKPAAAKQPAPSAKAPVKRSSRPASPAAAAPPEAVPVDAPAEALPVPGVLVTSPGEEPWTEAEVDEVRAELTREALELRSQLSSSTQGLAALLRDSGDGAGDDQADAGAKTFEREHEMSVANNVRDMLTQVERAVARLDSGRYGTCESCGEPIGKARLQVFPRATLCRTCKQREERR